MRQLGLHSVVAHVVSCRACLFRVFHGTLECFGVGCGGSVPSEGADTSDWLWRRTGGLVSVLGYTSFLRLI